MLMINILLMLLLGCSGMIGPAADLTELPEPEGNHAPVVFDDPFSWWVVQADRPFRYAVLATDEDGDSLTYDLVTTAAHGTMAFESDGKFVYTPTSGYVGGDGFTYRVTDGWRDTTVVITFRVNAEPVAKPDTFYVVAGSTILVSAPGVLANDSDRNGDPLTAIAAADNGMPDPAHGEVELFYGDGGFRYTPQAGFVGTDRFRYRASETTSRALESAAVEIVLVVRLPQQ